MVEHLVPTHLVIVWHHKDPLEGIRTMAHNSAVVVMWENYQKLLNIWLKNWRTNEY